MIKQKTKSSLRRAFSYVKNHTKNKRGNDIYDYFVFDCISAYCILVYIIVNKIWVVFWNVGTRWRLWIPYMVNSHILISLDCFLLYVIIRKNKR